MKCPYGECSRNGVSVMVAFETLSMNSAVSVEVAVGTVAVNSAVETV